MEDQDGRTNRQIQEQKRALKKLPWKRKSLVLAVFVLLRGRFRERFRRNGKRDLGWTILVFYIRFFPHKSDAGPIQLQDGCLTEWSKVGCWGCPSAEGGRVFPC